MGRPPKLKDVMEEQAEQAEQVKDSKTESKKEISTAEAQVLCKLGMSQIQHSEKARKALTVYLEHVLMQADVDDDDANAVINILKMAATSTHKKLCDDVLTKYLNKFSGLIPQEKK